MFEGLCQEILTHNGDTAHLLPLLIGGIGHFENIKEGHIMGHDLSRDGSRTNST